MLDSREKQIEELIHEELGAAPVEPGAINHDIYEPRLTAAGGPVPRFDYVPHCIYFYYVRIDNNGKLRIDHYLDADGPLDDPTQWRPIPYSSVPERLHALAINGRPGTEVKDPPKLPNHNFDGIKWRRKSYIAVFLDEVNWRFHTRDGGKAAWVFKAEPPMTPNHSFFDAKDVKLTLPNSFTGRTDSRSALYFINHMKRNEAGDDLIEGDEQVFEFEMFLKVQFAEATTNTLTVILDPTGTNQGPPETP